MNAERRKTITFPATCIALGSAESVSYSTRFAWVKLPGVDKPIRIARSRLEHPERVGAFHLADRAQAEAKRQKLHRQVRRALRRALG